MKSKRILSFLLAVLMMFTLATVTNTKVYAEGKENTKTEDKKSDDKNSDSGTRIVTDMAGNKVEVPNKINRVVVLTMYPLPSVITTYLGSGKKVVGMDPFSMIAAKNGVLGKLFPDILKANTKFMDGNNVNVEELLALKPDVVLYNSKNEAQKKLLENANLKGIAVNALQNDFNCIATYNDWFKLMNQLFPGEGPKDDKITAYSKKVYDDIQNRVKDIKDKKKALFLFSYTDKARVVSGKNFFGNFWINMAGGDNVAKDEDAIGPNVKVDMEQIYKWNPDIIYITNFSPAMPEDLYENKIGGDDWSKVNAVKNKQVYKMPLGAYRTYTPGVDTPVTMYWVAKQMYPEQFKDIDISKEFKDYYKNFFNVELTDEDINNILNPPREVGNR